MTDFRSDNTCPPSAEVLSAVMPLLREGCSPYAEDEITRAVQQKFCEIFDHDLVFFPLFTGTAANALAITQISQRFGEVICHRGSHIFLDECGAVEHQSQNRLLPAEGPNGKIDPDRLPPLVDNGDVHRTRPGVLSLSQCTEFGAAYRAAEIRALSDPARSAGLKVHMDGTRFANALAFTGVHPADLTWRAGVDVLCLGATKNGAIGAEAVLFFNPAEAAGFARLMKRSGHLASRLWFLSAQISAWLEDGFWLKAAAHSNAMAMRLERKLYDIGIAPLYPVESNMVFLPMTATQSEELSREGFRHYPIVQPGGELAARLVMSHSTTKPEVDRLAGALSRILRATGNAQGKLPA